MLPFVQKFAAAVDTLVGDGPIKQRLASAYSLYLADLAAHELPAQLRHEFDALQAALTRVAPAGSETRVRASVQKMAPTEAAGHASSIVSIYVELLSTLERAEPLKVVGQLRKPRYLTGR